MFKHSKQSLLKSVCMLLAAVMLLMTSACTGANPGTPSANDTPAPEAVTSAPAAEPSPDVPAVSTSEPSQAPTEEPTAEPTEEPTAVPGMTVGDGLTLGRYEQDGDESNGPEPIEWIVLDTDGSKALVISKYTLGSIVYPCHPNITWETSEMRAWLNSDFIDSVFDDAERALICETHVVNGEHPIQGYDTSSGRDTDDKVFLLSLTEAQTYFATDKDRMACSLIKAQEHSEFGEMWWLRTSGAAFYFQTEVMWDGSIDPYGLAIIDDGSGGGQAGLRPAMWIELG
ncbi:MAG: DUF6273 domain-containing protein [Clostridiales bacterium]|nr:DUF6273 domain-containing protein [Clostridiales bacterium]